ncbi:hypothetical protein [Pseudomonas fluorescens]|uniref:hypothetical protein n=1 Tax=Pseudomonas TaxID=286 RepID=UPI003D074FC6
MQSTSQLAEWQLKKAFEATGRRLERGFWNDQKNLEGGRAAFVDVTGATFLRRVGASGNNLKGHITCGNTPSRGQLAGECTARKTAAHPHLHRSFSSKQWRFASVELPSSKEQIIGF